MNQQVKQGCGEISEPHTREKPTNPCRKHVLVQSCLTLQSCQISKKKSLIEILRSRNPVTSLWLPTFQFSGLATFLRLFIESINIFATYVQLQSRGQHSLNSFASCVLITLTLKRRAGWGRGWGGCRGREGHPPPTVSEGCRRESRDMYRTRTGQGAHSESATCLSHGVVTVSSQCS